ncbi:MAG TPA: hypothetical protein VHD33_05395, partial [Legionellaceae bacterium]|nr:hypothetical protein [Legionellaceae bacterium]
AASALSATGLPVSFGTTAVCLLAGTGVIMLATAVITGALATCFFSAIGDVFHNGQGSDFASGLWS